MVWLTSQSVGLLIVGCLAIAGLVAIVSRYTARAVIPERQRDAAHAICSPLMSPLGWAATSPGVNAEPIHAALVRYLSATRTYEWRGSSAARGNDAATASAVADLEKAVRAQAARPAIGTPTSTELLASMDALTADRRARLAAASRQLPSLYVITLAVSGAALIANAGVLTMRAGFRSALIIGGLTLVIGLSIALIFALGTPWQGTIVVSGGPIDGVIHDITTGYFHP